MEGTRGERMFHTKGKGTTAKDSVTGTVMIMQKKATGKLADTLATSTQVAIAATQIHHVKYG